MMGHAARRDWMGEIRHLWRRWTFPRTPQRVFALLYVCSGLLFLVIIPPMQVADENAHTLRAYQVSQGQMLTTHTELGAGGRLPTGLVQFVDTANMHATRPLIDQKFRPRQTWAALGHLHITPLQQTVAFDNTAIYPPVNYVIPALGMDAAHLLSDRPLVLFYAARIANCAFLGIALYWAIRWLTRGKWALVVIGLLPMVLYEAVSVSADVYLLAVAALFIAYWSRLYGQVVIERREWLAIGALAVLLALSKQSYAVFVPLLLLLSVPVWRQRAARNQRLLRTGVICAVAVCVAAIWFVGTSATNADFVLWAASFGAHISPAAQETFVLHHPVSFVTALGNTLLTNNGDGILRSFMGNFGWLDTPLPLSLSLGAMLALLLGFGLDKPLLPRLEWRTTWWTIAIASGAVVVLAGGLYLYWTPVGSGLVLGFQGRYFMPMLILLVPVLAGRYAHNIRKRQVFLLLIAVLVGMAIVLAYRYYTLPSFI